MFEPIRLPIGPVKTRDERMGTNNMFDICSGQIFSSNYIGTAIRREKHAEQLNPNPNEPTIVVRMKWSWKFRKRHTMQQTTIELDKTPNFLLSFSSMAAKANRKDVLVTQNRVPKKAADFSSKLPDRTA